MIRINDSITIISIAKYNANSSGGVLSSGSCIKYRDKNSEWYWMESFSNPSCFEML